MDRVRAGPPSVVALPLAVSRDMMSRRAKPQAVKQRLVRTPRSRMSESKPAVDLETDPRFPSGPWVGFFLQRQLPGRHYMEIRLTFRQGVMTGEGRDRVGDFLFAGR